MDLLEEMAKKSLLMQRTPYPTEDDYFRKNPHVGGMAASDNKIIMNQFSTLTDQQKNAVRLNEYIRLQLRNNPIQGFNITPEQQQKFSNYSDNPTDVIDTIVGRVLSGDPSAGNVNPNQMQIINEWLNNVARQ